MPDTTNRAAAGSGIPVAQRYTVHAGDDARQLGQIPPNGVYVLADAYDEAGLIIEGLQKAQEAPDSITAAPAETYELLRKQFLSLRSLANSNSRMVSYWRSQCGRETREVLLANAANVNAERDTNAMLTNALEETEALCTSLRQQRDDMSALLREFRKGAVLSPANLDRIDALLAAAGVKHGV